MPPQRCLCYNPIVATNKTRQKWPVDNNNKKKNNGNTFAAAATSGTTGTTRSIEAKQLAQHTHSLPLYRQNPSSSCSFAVRNAIRIKRECLFVCLFVCLFQLDKIQKGNQLYIRRMQEQTI
jgi:hypothetical protein